MALTCFLPEPTLPEDKQLAITIYPLLLFISSLFLIATFVVYAILPGMRNIHGVTIMCFLASLTCMFIGLGIIQLWDRGTLRCLCIGNGKMSAFIRQL